MKTKEDINNVLVKIDGEGTAYPGMTYENGVIEALMWVLEEISDNEFEFSK